MSTKSNPKTVQTRKRSARKSIPACIGITQLMQARPVLHVARLSGPDNEVSIYLQPVPYFVFFDELKAMRHAGFNSIEPDGPGVCPNCDASCAVGVTYFQRHRTGKKNLDTQRGFEFCFDCNMVTEVMLTDMQHMPAGALIFLTPEHQDD